MLVLGVQRGGWGSSPASRVGCGTAPFGGYVLLDERNRMVAGYRFDLTAEEVIAYCKGDQ